VHHRDSVAHEAMDKGLTCHDDSLMGPYHSCMLKFSLGCFGRPEILTGPLKYWENVELLLLSFHFKCWIFHWEISANCSLESISSAHRSLYQLSFLSSSSLFQHCKPNSN
jgi:hypothetical protein